MGKTLCLYKPIGITPLQLITQYKEKHHEYSNLKLGYAGRLDPMADGLLLVLIGEENKNRKQYQDLPKEYESKIVFGIETDTYDTLGKLTNSTEITKQEALIKSVEAILPSFIGKYNQSYPPYSSKPVNGKPLYYWARSNKLDSIAIPTKDIEIYTIQVLSHSGISAEHLSEIIYSRIETVQGSFRQKEILDIWKNFFTINRQQIFPVIHLRISCSSGTYIRSLAHRLGKTLHTGAIALEITRKKIGEYTIAGQ